MPIFCGLSCTELSFMKKSTFCSTIFRKLVTQTYSLMYWLRSSVVVIHTAVLTKGVFGLPTAPDKQKMNKLKGQIWPWTWQKTTLLISSTMVIGTENSNSYWGCLRSLHTKTFLIGIDSSLFIPSMVKDRADWILTFIGNPSRRRTILNSTFFASTLNYFHWLLDFL